MQRLSIKPWSNFQILLSKDFSLTGTLRMKYCFMYDWKHSFFSFFPFHINVFYNVSYFCVENVVLKILIFLAILHL
jgi:hypothetical protein